MSMAMLYANEFKPWLICKRMLQHLAHERSQHKCTSFTVVLPNLSGCTVWDYYYSYYYTYCMLKRIWILTHFDSFVVWLHIYCSMSWNPSIQPLSVLPFIFRQYSERSEMSQLFILHIGRGHCASVMKDSNGEQRSRVMRVTFGVK